MLPWLITFTSERSLFGITIGAVLNNLTVVDLKPICSTMPCICPTTSILSPGWKRFSPIISIPAIRFLKRSCAPRATATENKPKPATSGPISIPKMSNMMARHIIPNMMRTALSSHIVIEGVNQVLFERIPNNGETMFIKALKIVNTTSALTRFSPNIPKLPVRGR